MDHRDTLGSMFERWLDEIIIERDDGSALTRRDLYTPAEQGWCRLAFMAGAQAETVLREEVAA
jgi:hypothetical protein